MDAILTWDGIHVGVPYTSQCIEKEHQHGCHTHLRWHPCWCSLYKPVHRKGTPTWQILVMVKWNDVTWNSLFSKAPLTLFLISCHVLRLFISTYPTMHLHHGLLRWESDLLSSQLPTCPNWPSEQNFGKRVGSIRILAQNQHALWDMPLKDYLAFFMKLAIT